MPLPEQLSPTFEEVVAGLVLELPSEGVETPFGAELLVETPQTAARLSLAACIRSGVSDSTADDTTSGGTYDYGIGFDDFNRPTIQEITSET